MKAKKKMGLLCEEGTENLLNGADTFQGWGLAGGQQGASFSVVEFQGRTCWRVHIRDNRAGSGWRGTYRMLRNSPVLEGEQISAQAEIFVESGGIFTSASVRFLGEKAFSGGDLYDFSRLGTWQKLRYVFTASKDDNGSIALYFYSSATQTDVDFVVYVYHPQLETLPYLTTFTTGIRAPSLLRYPLTAPLPDDFGIGLSARMLHESAVKDRTFWQAGPYVLRYDSAEEKLKMVYGEVCAEVEAEWDADDIIGVYGGQRDGKLFLQSKVAGEVGEEVESDLVQGEHPQIDTIAIGSSADGETGHVNAVLADFAYHFTSEKIDPAGYLSKVPGGGE